LITSLDNPRARQFRSLLQERTERRRQGLFVIEGVRLVRDALDAGVAPALVLYSAESVARAGARDLLARIPPDRLWEAAPAVLKALSETVTPQGILATVPLPAPAVPSGPIVLVLDGLRDPGNLGAILRTAPAAGVHTLLLTRGTVDPFNPKVVRAAMGGHFRANLAWDLDAPALVDLLGGRSVRLATPRGGAPPWEIDWHSPSALVIGGETQPATADLPSAERVTIPMEAGTESLNAAIATAILLFTVRQLSAIREQPSAPASGRSGL
jgi:TrmH family RNA methyltransferase